MYFRENLVDEPERDGNKEAKNVAPRNPLIALSNREELVGKATPCDSL